MTGPGVAGGLLGQRSNLEILNDNAPQHSIDFRRVYATILEDWLQVESHEILHDTFDRVPLFS